MKTQTLSPGNWLAGVDVPAEHRPTSFDTDDVYTSEGDHVCRMRGNVKYSYPNARAIAAAPDLICACIALVAAMPSDSIPEGSPGSDARAAQMERIAAKIKAGDALRKAGAKW